MSICQDTNALCFEETRIETKTPISVFYPARSHPRNLSLSLFQGSVPTACNLARPVQSFPIIPVRLDENTNYTTIIINDSTFVKNAIQSKRPIYFQLRDNRNCIFSPSFNQLFSQRKEANSAIVVTQPDIAAVQSVTQHDGQFPVKHLYLVAGAAAFIIGIALVMSIMYAKRETSSIKSPKKEIKEELEELDIEPENLVINMQDATYLNSGPDSFEWTANQVPCTEKPPPIAKAATKLSHPTSLYWESKARTTLMSLSVKKYAHNMK